MKDKSWKKEEVDDKSGKEEEDKSWKEEEDLHKNVLMTSQRRL